MSNDVNSRFIEVFEYLLACKYVTSKADFLTKIGISSSMFTEISKGRSNLGLKVLQNTVNIYPFINLHWWITGLGEMLLPSENNGQKNTSTPNTTTENTSVSIQKTTLSLHPTLDKKLHPALHPTENLGLPKVITVSEQTGNEVVSLVSVKAAAGYLNGYADPEFMEKLPTIRMPSIKGATHRAFEVSGHSMNPTLHNKSIVIGRWEESLNNIRDRRIYVVVTKNDGVVIKRVLNRVGESGKLILISDNQNKKEFPNIILDADEVLEIWYLRGGLMYEFPEPNEFYNRFNDLEAQVTLMAAKMEKLIK